MDDKKEQHWEKYRQYKIEIRTDVGRDRHIFHDVTVKKRKNDRENHKVSECYTDIEQQCGAHRERHYQAFFMLV